MEIAILLSVYSLALLFACAFQLMICNHARTTLIRAERLRDELRERRRNERQQINHFVNKPPFP